VHPLDDLFHACAWEAFMCAAAEGKELEKEPMRIDAYRLYEERKEKCAI